MKAAHKPHLKSPLHQYTKLLKLKGYTLTIPCEACEYLANQCSPETGARALQSLCSELFTNILYDPAHYADKTKKILITTDIAKELLQKT